MISSSTVGEGGSAGDNDTFEMLSEGLIDISEGTKK